MKTTKILLAILLAAVLAASGCAPMEDYPDATEKPQDEPSEVMLSLSDVNPQAPENSANIQLGFNLALLKELSKKEKNIFYSSFSINQALSMLIFGSAGQTQEEIKSILGYADLTIKDVAAYQKYLLDIYKDTGDTTFYSANSLWIDDDLTVKNSYIDTMDKSFQAEVENLDLQDDVTITKLNDWIDQKTKGMITKLFDEPLGDTARLVLMNAIYFKGQWTVPFDPDRTSQLNFNGKSGTQAADMMFSDEEVQGYESNEYKSIMLPYGEDERFAFVAVLPEGDINEFINGLSEEDLADILKTFETKDEPRIYIPKFEMEEKVTLNDTLKALGMQTAFTGNADFSEISDTNLFVSQVLHKAKIKIDEEGTEAAAVTAIIMKLTSMPMNQFEFIADRPFIFFIVDTENNAPLFTGVMYDAE